MNPEILELFPIPVLTYKVTNISKEEIEIFELECNNQRGNDGNLTSVNTRVLDRPELQNIKDYITTVLQDYFKRVHNPAPDCFIYITQSWLNITNNNQHHHAHTHPNSIASGVLYLQTGPGDAIRFTSSLHQAITIPSKYFTRLNCVAVNQRVEQGDLIIFPSHLQHSVPTVKGHHTRISLSFNTFIKGPIGREESLTFLRLV
jgi:uncharacterized protein (TIGR02466 family)